MVSKIQTSGFRSVEFNRLSNAEACPRSVPAAPPGPPLCSAAPGPSSWSRAAIFWFRFQSLLYPHLLLYCDHFQMPAFVMHNIAVKKQQHRFILIIFTLRDLPLYKEFLKVMWHLEIQWTWNTVHLILSENRERLSWRLIYNLVSCLFYQLRLLRRKWCTGGSC